MERDRVLNRGVKKAFGLGAWLLTILMFTLLPLGQAWGNTVIDPFDTVQTIQASAPTGGWMGWDTVVGGDILGGNRDMRLDYTAGGGGSLFRVRAAGSTFTHDQEVGVQGRSETRWDGMTAFDLTEGGTVDTLVLFHVTNDHTSSILFTVNGTSTYTVDLPSAGSPWIEIVIPFSGFSDPIALQSVNSITMLIPDTGSSIATDLKITEISTRISQPPLPPPATVPTLSEWGMILFTLLMGMSGVVFIRRRKMRG